MSVLLAWEDTYFREFDRTLRRVYKQRHPGSQGRLEAQSVEGVDNFPRFVKRDWPRFRDTGFPRAGSPPLTHVICVADADALVEHIPGVPALPDADTSS